MNPWLAIAIGYVSIALVMAMLWLVQLRTRNAGIVDVGWTFGVAALAVFFSAVSTEGNTARRWLAAILPALWGFRLGGYLLVRVLSHAEDPRYVALKASWGANPQPRLFWFYQSQAIACVLFAVPMLLAARGASPIGATDYLAVLVWVIAILGETIADRQLARFRRDPINAGQVCNVGLWRYSRHPNYFFEWVHWWAYVLLAATSPWGWLALTAPAAMLYLFWFVTGIPLAEQQAIRSRGEAYRQYQRETSPFFPWPPRRGR